MRSRQSLCSLSFLTFIQSFDISAVRRNYCFTVVSRGRCSDEISAKTTFQDCCCGVGKGWGDKELCQLCPDKETGGRFCHLPFVPRRNIICLCGFRKSEIQTSLLSYKN